MNDRIVPDVAVSINGAPLQPQARLDLLEVSISDTLDLAGAFTIKLHAWDLDRAAVTWIDGPPFGLGALVAIRLGYVDGPMVQAIAGDIAELEADFDADRTPTLTVTGYDLRKRLDRGPLKDTYLNMRDSDIAAKVIARNRLPPVIIPTATVHAAVSQHEESDLRFLQRRAKLNGYELLLDDKGIYFGPPRVAAKPILTLGDDLLAFSPTVTGDLVSEIKVPGDDTTAAERTYVARATTGYFPGLLAGTDIVSPHPEEITVVTSSLAEAQTMAQSQLRDRAARTVNASGRCKGNAALRAGQIVQLLGLGRRFSLPYRLTSVRHAFSQDRGFTTSFQCIGVT